jgi:uncharacterized membrane protein
MNLIAQIFLFILTLAFAAIGVFVFAASKGAIHEATASVWFLMSTVTLCSAIIVGTLKE